MLLSQVTVHANDFLGKAPWPQLITSEIAPGEYRIIMAPGSRMLVREVHLPNGR